MQVITPQVEGYLQNSSWIRRMFEAGIELKKKHGAENVCDFSLGNPDVCPPPAVAAAMGELADRMRQPLALGYMPNAGYPDVRAAVARSLAQEQGVPLTADHVVMTCGAAGAMNVIFRAVLEPGDEVVCPAPYFVEYVFYVENFGGRLRPVKSRPLSFDLDLDGLERAIGPKTRAVIVNSPNNPTGQIYAEREMRQLAALRESRPRATGRPFFLVLDEPYRFLAYDGAVVPPALPLYRYAVVVGSYSKSLSLAGERIGYLAVSPQMEEAQALVNGLVFTNRTLGFVNAPAVGQQLLRRALGAEVDLGVYDTRRRAMAGVLRRAGIEFAMPRGAFYFFPKVPGALDDTKFVQYLMEERVLAVPGTGFGYPGYFRLALCCDVAIIERSGERFKRAAARAASGG